MLIDGHEVDVIILAGGKNRRMEGRFKGSLAFRNEVFLDSIVNALRSREGSIYLSYASEEQAELIPDGCTVVYDNIRGAGPLAGLVSALEACSTEYAAVCACDMPLVSSELYRFLWNHVKATPDGSFADAVVPKTGDRLHPLAALYRRDILPALKEALRGGERKLSHVLQGLNTVITEITPFSALDLEVTNINTVAEYTALVESETAESGHG